MSKKKAFTVIEFKDIDSVIDHYAILNRNGVMTPGKLLSVDHEKERFTFELLGGPDKGKKISSRYALKQKANFYDYDHLSIMLLSC
jgi:hypothetical protein